MSFQHPVQADRTDRAQCYWRFLAWRYGFSLSGFFRGLFSWTDFNWFRKLSHYSHPDFSVLRSMITPPARSMRGLWYSWWYDWPFLCKAKTWAIFSFLHRALTIALSLKPHLWNHYYHCRYLSQRLKQQVLDMFQSQDGLFHSFKLLYWEFCLIFCGQVLPFAC